MKSLASHHFSNLAELRDAVLRIAATFDHPDTILPNGPMTLNVIEETLSDKSTVLNFEIVPRHGDVARTIDREAGLPDLLEALELAAECLMAHHFETPKARLGEACDICAKRSESVFTVIQAAITKAKGNS